MSSAALASSVPGSVPLPALPILFVDDEPENLTLVRLTFGEQFQVLTASGGPEALAILEKRDVGVLVSDERMPVMGGIELLARASERWPDTVRVIVSAYGDVSRVLAALNRGQASEYILKPWAPDDLRGCLTRSLAIADRRRTLRARAELASVLCENGTAPGRALVGWSGGLAPIAGLVERLAGTDVTVLITGETGTGKEQVARAIHARSARRDQPFVPVNCGALAEGLLESELFGHEAGAFTGAARTRKGRFELAHGGTLFLDEIGDISPRMQVALLRVLQERCLERVGGGRSIAVDVRIVAATHRDLRALVRDGRFREDLHYRLAVLSIEVPPLRDRPEDLGPLVEHFIAKYRHMCPGGGSPRLGDETLEALAAYRWPGNVRELENMVQRAMVLCDGELLSPDDFSFYVPPTLAPETIRDEAKRAECARLRELLLSQGGNFSRAARVSGVPRTTLVSRAKKLGLL